MSNNNKSLPYISRRVFLGGMGLTAAGLYFGIYALKNGRTAKDFSALNPNDDKSFSGLNPNVFIHIAPVTGLVSVVCHRSEMGQGVRSSLPVLLADELGADMNHVKVIQGEGNKAYGDQNTDGSSSVRGVYTYLRSVAATARMMLITAAAQKLQVSEDELTTENHFVIHTKTNQKISFADLSLAAASLPIPTEAQVKLRPETELKRIGTKLPLLDGPDYVSGKAVFGADVSLPEMLISVIARPPVLGGKVKSFDKEAAIKVPGVQKVIEIPYPKPPYGFQPFGGVAVLANNTWAAMKGREALNVQWDNIEEHANFNTEDYQKLLKESVNTEGKAERNVGDVDKALKESVKTLEAEYYVPHLPHLTMEPPVALAKYHSSSLVEVWAPTQNPQAVQTEVARMMGLKEENILVHVTMLGGGFGRKSKADFCSEAAYLSKAAGVPVRVQWTRQDDIRNDYLNAINAQHITAGLDKDGKVVAWKHRTAFTPIPSTFNPQVVTPGPGDLQQGILDLALDVPNVRFEACKAVPHVRVGWLRSVYNIFHSFAVNSFIDEIAHARKKDSLQTMLEIYGPAKNRSLEDLGVKELRNYEASVEDHPVDGERLHNILKHVAKLSNWDKNKNVKGKGLGLAVHRSFNSYAAVAASVIPSKTKGGFPIVDEIWIALDAGRVINPDRVHSQLEGSVISGMNHFLYGGITHKNGEAEQSNFDGIQVTRMSVAPRKIHTDIVITNGLHGGVGEPGVPPVAPAIANAVFALTGKRIREFNATKLFS